MNLSLVRGLPHWLLSAAWVSVLLVDSGWGYARDGNPWRLLGMLGWLVFAAAWFLRPAVFSFDASSATRKRAALALISARQSAVLQGAGLLVVALALAGRYSSAG